VVTTTKTPQLVLLQPLPDNIQESAVLGFEPATGVNVAAMVADPPEATLAGAAICNEKLLVIVTVANVCFAGSAALCAVTVTVAGFGKIGGAV